MDRRCRSRRADFSASRLDFSAGVSFSRRRAREAGALRSESAIVDTVESTVDSVDSPTAVIPSSGFEGGDGRVRESSFASPFSSSTAFSGVGAADSGTSSEVANRFFAGFVAAAGDSPISPAMSSAILSAVGGAVDGAGLGLSPPGVSPGPGSRSPRRGWFAGGAHATRNFS